jgi:hypothetical protein
MKQCPTCHRTYVENSLAYCLDDGSTLLMVDSSSFDAPPTMRMPEPRITDQPQPPFQQSFQQPLPPPPGYAQPSPASNFKVNNRMLGIAGAALVIVGVIMPLVSLMGILGFSYLQIAQLDGRFFTGYLIPLLGGFALFLTLKSQYKPLIGIGIAVLAIIVIDYLRIKSTIASIPFNLPGARPGATVDPMAGQYLQSMLQISVGFFALVGGAILLIVAGAMKDKAATSSTSWPGTSPPPPPPMNYR